MQSKNAEGGLMHAETVFAELRPPGLWKHFAEITRIPRPSGHEELIAAYVQAWAEKLGHPVLTDAVGNLCVHVPGSPGRTQAPAAVLQGHLDMVCERDSNSPYDPERGQIHLIRDGDWVLAEGTTLGADNGVSVAAMLHVGELRDVEHGPLDLLFTVDEERGLTGAQSLDAGLLRGRTLLNLDNEEDGQLCVGCAGSSDVLVTFRGVREPVPAGCVELQVRVSGLLGGHSGIDIVKPRLNAIRCMALLIQQIASVAELRLVLIKGGNKRNAIPREATASILVPVESEESIKAMLVRERDQLRAQFADADSGLEVETTPSHPTAVDAWSVADSQRLLNLITAIPCGVLAMSPAVPGLVETSNSVGTAETDGDRVRIGCLIRSSVDRALTEVADTLRAVAGLAVAEAKVEGGYPGWQPNLNSRLLKVTCAAFKRVFDQEPTIRGVHAGLECGIIGARVPGMDMISFGPEIRGPHAPGERVEIGSVERFWKLLVVTLDDLSR